MGLLIEIAIVVKKTLLSVLNKYKTWRKSFFAEVTFLFSDIKLMMYYKSRTWNLLWSFLSMLQIYSLKFKSSSYKKKKKRLNSFYPWTHCMEYWFFCFTGGGPALCLVWWVRWVDNGAWKKVQLQLYRSSSPTAVWRLRACYGTCRPL